MHVDRSHEAAGTMPSLTSTPPYSKEISLTEENRALAAQVAHLTNLLQQYKESTERLLHANRLLERRNDEAEAELEKLREDHEAFFQLHQHLAQMKSEQEARVVSLLAEQRELQRKLGAMEMQLKITEAELVGTETASRLEAEFFEAARAQLVDYLLMAQGDVSQLTESAVQCEPAELTTCATQTDEVFEPNDELVLALQEIEVREEEIKQLKLQLSRVPALDLTPRRPLVLMSPPVPEDLEEEDAPRSPGADAAPTSPQPDLNYAWANTAKATCMFVQLMDRAQRTRDRLKPLMKGLAGSLSTLATNTAHLANAPPDDDSVLHSMVLSITEAMKAARAASRLLDDSW